MITVGSIPEASADRTEDVTGHSGRHRRLVIADDSAEMRELVRDAAGSRFDEVVEVADGRQLFWQLLRTSFTTSSKPAPELVVISDYKMPGYDGLQVLDALRELDDSVATILITAFPSEDVAARANELGATLLAKPFTVSKLRNVLDDLLDSRG
ncbi:MAG TPA: response regulator [Kofleriaceae bacterium]|nr:response regulator [Kofleriaceae bacterium]